MIKTIDIPSSMTLPKLAVNTPTPPNTPIANNIGTYTGGNDSISSSSAAKALSGVHVVANAVHPAIRDCRRVFLVSSFCDMIPDSSLLIVGCCGCDILTSGCNLF